MVSPVGKAVSHFQIVAGLGEGGMGVVHNILHAWLAVALLITTTASPGVAFSVPDGGPTLISVDASDAPRGIFPYCKASYSQGSHAAASWGGGVLPLG